MAGRELWGLKGERRRHEAYEQLILSVLSDLVKDAGEETLLVYCKG